MANSDTYRIKKSEYSATDPATFIEVDLGGINSTATDLSFVGRTREYGEIYNENILRLLENFDSPEVEDTRTQSVYHAVPEVLVNPTNGQTWFNSTRKINYVYFRGRWIPNAYTGHVASNWGTVTSGTALPRPIGESGYVFPYEECAWIIAPAVITEETKGISCSVNPSTGIVTATFTDQSNVAKPMEVFYQIIGVRGNDALGGDITGSLRVLLNTHIQQTTVPYITSFPSVTTSAGPIVATTSGVASGNTVTYQWTRVSPSQSTGFPSSYNIEPVSPTSASTEFRITVNSPGVFVSTERVIRGATFVCTVEERNSSNVVVETKTSLPVRIEFANY